MRYMLDTNICIYSIKHKPKQVFLKLQEHDPEDICISSVTYAELVHGVEKSQAIEKNQLALAILLANIEVLDFDSAAAESYGKIRAYLEKQGTPIGPLDTMIAGHAKSLDYVLVTNNTKGFSRVQDLKLENWAKWFNNNSHILLEGDKIMSTNKITCSFTVDRDIYNAYKSIVVKGGENVKGNLVRYMLNVINYETSNADTISAIKEVEELKKIQTKKPMLHLESF